MPKFKTAFTAVLIGAVVGIPAIMLATNKPGLPEDMLSKADFVVYEVPDCKLKPNSWSFNDQNRVLSYSCNYDGIDITLNQQATPEAFNDIPDYYPALLEKLNKITTLSTKAGDVHLTQPIELKGKQTAVNNHDGTLIFVQPVSNLDESRWRRIFNSLESIR